MRPCPCCAGKGEVPDNYGLTDKQQRVFDALVKRPRSNMALQILLYADNINGGPARADKAVRLIVVSLRKRLRPHGMTVRSTCGQYAMYRLERIT